MGFRLPRRPRHDFVNLTWGYALGGGGGLRRWTFRCEGKVSTDQGTKDTDGLIGLN